MEDHVILGSKVYTESGVMQNVCVVVREGRIVEIIKNSSSAPKPTLELPEHYHLLPGFIDLHIHGANAFDVMDGTQEALAGISHALVAEGTTAYLATTLTASKNAIERALKAVKDYSTDEAGAAILGVHLEGPFLSPQQVGAQNAEYLLKPDVDDIKQWQALSAGAVKMVTLAPELPNAVPMIHYLKQNQIIAAMGHTNATYPEALSAITAGCSYATHLFNAMRGIHHREPGVVTAALLAESVTTELIADGLHLHPAIIELIFRLKKKEKIVLVTDAMRAKCLGDGTYDLGGQTVTVQGNKACLADGRLAGSVLTLSDAVKNMVHFAHIHLADVVKMVSENPAKLLGLFHRKGSIAVQKDADLVVLDDQLAVVMTLCRGQVVYRKATLLLG